MVTEDPSSHVHAWIDNELFIDALNILFKDLLSCTELVKNITIGLKQIGLSTCRIIIGHSEIPDLSKCDGPYQLSSCPSYEYNIKNSQTIISMHGGYIQAWKTPDASKCFFEINLICMSGNEGDENDRF